MLDVWIMTHSILRHWSIVLDTEAERARDIQYTFSSSESWFSLYWCLGWNPHVQKCNTCFILSSCTYLSGFQTIGYRDASFQFKTIDIKLLLVKGLKKVYATLEVKKRVSCFMHHPVAYILLKIVQSFDIWKFSRSNCPPVPVQVSVKCVPTSAPGAALN